MTLSRFARRSLQVLTTTALALLAAGTADAQLPQTRLYGVFPAGGKAGSSFDLLITNGDDLDDVDRLVFTHPGITAQPKMQEVAGKQKPVDRSFVVAVAADVPSGLHEVRAVGKYGISNPRVFVVGDQEEVRETEPNNDFKAAAPIAQGQVVNGQSTGNADVDVYKFQGSQGQRIIVRAQASRLDSRMRPALELYDARGRRLAFAREQVRQDALLDVPLPADGEYFVRIFDFVYSAGPEFTYRLVAGPLPHVDYVWPPAGLPGTTSNFTVYGRNLPGGQPTDVKIDGRPIEKLDVQIALPGDPAALQMAAPLNSYEAGVDGVPYVVKGPAGSSNPRMVYLATAPLAAEAEPNDKPEQAQKVTPPVEIAGQFQARRDADTFSFEAKAGEVWIIEAYAQRSGTPADPYLVVDQITKDDKGAEKVNRLTAVDDDQTNLLQNTFETQTDDPAFRLQAPADGTYRVTLRDRYFESQGSPKLVYRLAVRREQPDYRAVVVPLLASQQPNQPSGTASVALRKGDNAAAAVMVFRRDGFDGAVDVWAEGLPQGVTCKGASLSAAQPSANLVFTAAEDAPEWSGPIQVLSKARVADPAKQRAVAAAKAQIKPATDALPKLAEAVQKTQEAANKANEVSTAAKTAAAQKTDDQNLANQAKQAEEAATKAAEALKKAQEEQAAGQKKLADAEAAVKTAEAELAASVKEVAHPTRFGTVVWTGQNGMPGSARVAQSISLSVLKEPAPYQLSTDVFRVAARPSRQILVPVKVARRSGFDNNVNLQFVGLPNSAQIQVENKAIEKDKAEQVFRIFVNGNAPVGTYTLVAQGTGQFNYSRNPEAAERAKAEQQEVAKAFETATEAAKAAVTARDQAIQKANQDAELLKQAQAKKEDAAKQVAAANQAVQQAEQEKNQAAADKKAEADAKFAAAQEAAKKAAEALTAAEKAQTDADAVAKASAEAKTKGEEGAKQAEEARKAAEQAKQAADKKAQDAENAAKPKNVNVITPSTPVVIEVKPAPVTLSANVPNGGSLKRGDKLEVKVGVTRVNDFRGPVTLTLPLPPGIAGLSAAPVAVPAEQNEGTLVIQAAGDATAGQLQYMVIQAKADFDGEALVDAPINVNVQ